jgi:hypothetical protein
MGIRAKGEESMRLENQQAAFFFDAKSGALTTLLNKATGTEIALPAGCADFAITVDPDTGDIWQAKPFSSSVFTLDNVSGNTAVTLKADKTAGTLTAEYIFSTSKGQVQVRRTVVLSADVGEITVRMEITNSMHDATVLTAQPLAIAGLTDGGNGWSLLWPWKEGEIRKDAVTRVAGGQMVNLNAGYPVPFSMQFMALFNEKESLYYGVHDKEAVHKNFLFEKFAGGVKMACSQWVFVAPGETKQAAPVVIALKGTGGWTAAADTYRTFIEEDSGWIRKGSPMAQNFTGWYPFNMSQYENRYKAAYVKGAPNGAFTTMLQVSSAARNKTGMDMTLFLGWHLDGFDSRYPDYTFQDAMGGERGFQEAVESIHQNGGQVMMYMNNHIAETKSAWYQTLRTDGKTMGEASAILTDAGTVYHEDYGTGLDYVAMCPMAQDWITANTQAVQRLRQNGTDAIWLDQMMEMPSALCFNKEHGHSTPATAFSEGYENMMEAFNAVMETGGSDYLYGCEGVCDAYIRWIDVCGMMWARKLGFSEETAPETTRYTLPSKILGLPGDKAFGRAEYARAFVMGEPFLAASDNAQLPVYTSLYKSYPEIYLYGRYTAENGLTGLPDGWRAGVLLGADGNSAAIQLFHEKGDVLEAEIHFAAPGKIVSILDVLAGNAASSGPDACRVSLKAGETASIIISWVTKGAGQ